MNRLRKVLISVVAISLLTTGCYGSFAGFNKLKTWNQELTDQRWINEAVFLGLVLIPVYELVLFGDAIIFNSVAFWTGSNPMDRAEINLDGDRKAVQKFSETQDGKELQILFYDKGTLQHSLTLSQTSGSSLLSGHLAEVGGRTEDFSVQATADGLQVTKMDVAGQWTSQLYSGDSLDRISLKVARIMETQRMAAVVH